MTFSRKKILFLVVTVIAVTFVWHWENTPAQKQEIPSKPVKTAIVTATPFQPTESFSGFVNGVRHADVAPKIPGYVISLLKESGDIVQAGETIAILDAGALDAQSESARSSLESAITAFTKTEKYLNQTVDEAKAHLAKAKESRDSGNASNKDVRIAEEAVKSAEKMRSAEIARAQSSVVLARGGSTVSSAIAQDRFIKAPFTGTITSKHTSVGSYAGPGSTLYTIASADAVEIPVSVPADLADVLIKGSPVTITPERSGDSLEGFVASVVSAVDKNTGETLVRVRPKNSSTPLHIGQYATIAFPSATERSALLIPESSVSRVYDDTFVFVVQNGIATQKPVTLGDRSGDRIEVLSGLGDGDTLVTEGMYGLRHGANVSNQI